MSLTDLLLGLEPSSASMVSHAGASVRASGTFEVTSAVVRRHAILLHREQGQNLRDYAAVSRMSDRSLLLLLEYNKATGDVHLRSISFYKARGQGPSSLTKFFRNHGSQLRNSQLQ